MKLTPEQVNLIKVSIQNGEDFLQFTLEQLAKLLKVSTEKVLMEFVMTTRKP